RERVRQGALLPERGGGSAREPPAPHQRPERPPRSGAQRQLPGRATARPTRRRLLAQQARPGGGGRAAGVAPRRQVRRSLAGGRPAHPQPGRRRSEPPLRQRLPLPRPRRERPRLSHRRAHPPRQSPGLSRLEREGVPEDLRSPRHHPPRALLRPRAPSLRRRRGRRAGARPVLHLRQREHRPPVRVHPADLARQPQIRRAPRRPRSPDERGGRQRPPDPRRPRAPEAHAPPPLHARTRRRLLPPAEPRSPPLSGPASGGAARRRPAADGRSPPRPWSPVRNPVRNRAMHLPRPISEQLSPLFQGIAQRTSGHLDRDPGQAVQRVVIRQAFAYLRRHYPILVLPRFAVVTRYDDVKDVLARDEDFGVTEVYAERMERTSGPFILGMERTARYEREAAWLRGAVHDDD